MGVVQSDCVGRPYCEHFGRTKASLWEKHTLIGWVAPNIKALLAEPVRVVLSDWVGHSYLKKLAEPKLTCESGPL